MYLVIKTKNYLTRVDAMKQSGQWLNNDIGLLILRFFTGTFMLIMHGIPKLLSFDRLFHTFSDPLGLGSELSYSLALLAEILCSFMLVIGLFTRFAVVPLIITMLVAAFIIHGGDPWSRKEMALIYAVSFIAIFFTGPGKYSVDKLREKK